MNNKIIIIGGDHSNTLGVIRALGENGIKSTVVIISDYKKAAVLRSKYINKSIVCKDEEQALLMLQDIYKDEKYKPILIPTSDKAAAIIDCNYERLSKLFIVQNICNKQGEIIRYMNKYEQYKAFSKFGINIAKSQIVNYPFDNNIEQLNFPIIIKPLLSIEGEKSDIRVANNKKEYADCIKEFKDNKYQRVLLQEKIDFDYECDMSGYSYGGKATVAGYVHKERIWPVDRGSLTFGKVETINKAQAQIDKILRLIEKIGFTGLFDVEFFVKGNKFYLNEINFRNSGLTYLYGKSYLAYYYCKCCAERKFIKAPIVKKDHYVMDEQAEIHQLIDRNITLKEHLESRKKTSIYLVKNNNDKKPSRALLREKIFNNLKINKVILAAEKAIHKLPESVLLKLNKTKWRPVKTSKYKTIIVTQDNVSLLKADTDNYDEYRKLFRSKLASGIVLLDGEKVVARGIIKRRGTQDRFVKIINEDSFLLTNLFVKPEYRGEGLQSIVMSSLIEKFAKSKKANIYAVSYCYNIPSWKSLEKIGFEKKDNFYITRFMNHSLGKKKI